MNVEDLKHARLSKQSAGYLAAYMKLDDLYGEVTNAAELAYGSSQVDEVVSRVFDGFGQAGAELLRLFSESVAANVSQRANTTEL